MGAERQQQIIAAVSAELERQAKAGGASPLRLSGASANGQLSVSGQLDLLALGAAIDAALGGGASGDSKGPRGAGASPKESADQGLTPAELDASNDD